MPNNVKILLNGSTLDTESGVGLPFTLSKKTDRILEIVGADGIEVDNEFGSLTVPASKTNDIIYEQITELSPMPGFQWAKEAKVTSEGDLVMSGSAILKRVAGGHFPGNMELELLGDGHSVWAKLEGVSLRDIDMGLQEWTAATMQTSWVATPTTGYKGIFAPIVYGATTGVTTPGAWHERDMGLSVYFYTIVKAIFEKYLGYSLESVFFETPYFGRWAYAFAVGEDVKYENLPPAHVVDAYRVPGTSGTTDPIAFNIEYTDTNGEWDGDTFTADPDTSPDDYTLEFSGQGTNWGTFEIEVNGLVVFSTGPSYTIGGANHFQIIKTFSLATGDTLTTHAYTSGGTMFLYDVRKKIYTVPKPWEGADIVVSSCLHDVPAKDFLRGMSQMFNLAWGINDNIKRAVCEPRFPYRLYGGGTFVQYDGFYKQPVNTSALETISAVNHSEDFIFPFGRQLTLAYKKDDQNPLTDSYKAANNGNETLFRASRTFSAPEGEMQTVENALFSPLLLCSPDPTEASGGILPAILPSSHEITDEKLPTTEMDKRGRPTCGMVFRGAVSAQWDASGDVEEMPLLSQYKPFHVTGDHDDELNIGVFCDTVALPVDSGQVEQDLIGLVSTFFLQYFECLDPAIVTSLEKPPLISTFSSEDFRGAKNLVLGNGGLKFIAVLMEISNFDPALQSPANFTLLKLLQPTLGALSKVTHYPIVLQPPKPTGVCCDASASISDDLPSAGWVQVVATACRAIKRVEVLVDGARVYAGDLTPGTFGDATVTSDLKINISSSAIGAGLHTITVNITQDGCEPRQSTKAVSF